MRIAPERKQRLINANRAESTLEIWEGVAFCWLNNNSMKRPPKWSHFKQSCWKPKKQYLTETEIRRVRHPQKKVPRIVERKGYSNTGPDLSRKTHQTTTNIASGSRKPTCRSQSVDSSCQWETKRNLKNACMPFQSMPTIGIVKIFENTLFSTWNVET